MLRWQGQGWSRLSHGVHIGGGPAHITVTLVSVGPHSVVGLPPSLPEGRRDIQHFKQTNG